MLDGVSGWSAASGSLSIDESTFGAPGRLVLVVSQTSDGQPVGVNSDAMTLAAGQSFFIRLGIGSTSGEPAQVTLEASGQTPIQIPRRRAAVRPPGRALADGMDWHVAQGAVPAAGNWSLKVKGAGPTTGPRKLALFQPQVTEARADGLPPPFDPGPHATTDLNLPSWPVVLRPFLGDSSPTPMPSRSTFQTADGFNRSRRLFVDPPVNFRGLLRCDAAEADALEAFHRDLGTGAFYLVRPDTGQLCVATWMADGAPRPTDFRGPTTIYEVGLQLTLA